MARNLIHALKMKLSGKGGFKNLKLGKNVYRQMKRRGPPVPPRPQRRGTHNPRPPRRSS